MRGVPASPPPNPSASQPAVAGQHYENFPVASWLCPPHLRAPIGVIYAFARTADDIADEGDASPDERLEQLRAYRADLASAARGEAFSDQWPKVFGPVAWAMANHALPEEPMADLLSAFSQDIEMTRDGASYPGRTELLDYCRRSANPIGRLLLHLYEVRDDKARRQSDAICSALQLINFWQDISVDLPRHRHYLPDADLEAHGLAREQLQAFRPLGEAPPPAMALQMVRELVRWARALMMEGAPLVHRLPGRMGWELRFVVQGGLAILDKIEAQGFDSFSRRPSVGKGDLPRMAWKALWMRG
ncbi:squalene synthase HpnC [Variovorax sp. OV329]|uniref:squalene synthase HpnC n=1 Tax=Variovorax sp. OV329 TaxID=1882825 RepID=UPI0008F010EE|nr:squalene synthase HpnC [Variovorax sp. OV329]SFM47278.1 squalene synthase HpnC [Variovorax sp. OV329]